LAIGLANSMFSFSQFTVLEDATILSPDCVQLTPNSTSQRGAAWSDCTLDVAYPFTIELSVNLGGNNGGADGMAWLLQQIGPNATTTGNGGNMGYGNYLANGTFGTPAFDPSLIVEFDTWANDNVGDPAFDHVALQRDGTHNHNSPNCLAGSPPNFIQANANNANIEDGQDHSVLIEWDPLTQVFRMTFDGQERIQVTVDLENDVFAGNSTVWWGLTASTGGAANAHSFCLIEFSNPTGIPGLSLEPPPPYALCPQESGAISASAPGLTLGWNNTNSSTLIATVGTHVVQTTIDGCAQSETIAIESAAAPNLSVSAEEVTLCDNAPTVLNANADPGTTLDWDGTGLPALTVTENGTYTVVGTLATCTEELSVEVINQAPPQLSLSNGPSISICEGQTASVEAYTDIPADIQWVVNGAVQQENLIVIANQVTAEVMAEVAGCPGTSILLDIEMLPLPTASVSALPEELCWNQTGLVTAIPNPGSNLIGWDLPAGTPTPNQAGPGLYTAQLEGTNGCLSSASLVLNQLPPIDFAISAPLGACANESATLEVSGNYAAANWSTGAQGDFLELTLADGEGPFEVTVTQAGCQETGEAEIQWWPVPSTGILPDTVIRCVLDLPVQSNWTNQASPAIGWWVWTINDDVIPNGPAWNAEGDYTVRVFDSMTGCSDSAQVVVDVWPNLNIEATAQSSMVCWEKETEVFTELTAVEGTNLEEIPYTTTWSDPEIVSMTPTLGAGTYLLEVENACGSDVAIVDITQEYCGCDMWVPTAFTPDNDGVNDGFRVESNCPELDEFMLQVFNRWGELTWTTSNLDAAWMGQSVTNAAEGEHFVPDGIYGYRLTWKYKSLGVPVIQEKRGHIHLIR
jgi:gliding motility-associated-like protein